MKVELSDGTRSLSAVFKTVDEYEPVKRFDNGEVELQFTDSFEYEIAAYELDTILGLGIVPPAIRRRINRDVGSLSLWVEAVDRAGNSTVTPATVTFVRDATPPAAVTMFRCWLS